MASPLRIGTRESELAVWQATLVQDLLAGNNISSELVYIKSEGDLDTVTPLYQLGVQGVFTKTLDTALLNNRIDIAVHSMKDVPTLLADGIRQAAVLKRASYKDLLVYKDEAFLNELSYRNGEWAIGNNEQPASSHSPFIIATSSIRRKAQWLHRYPHHQFDNLRGNVNTRLRKLQESHWSGAIFASAGLDRINLRPRQSVELDWMLPAPAQGAIMLVCRTHDDVAYNACLPFNDEDTALCTKIERDFLKTLMGGCSTPISALATIEADTVLFRGNICSVDGRETETIEQQRPVATAESMGLRVANDLIQNGRAQKIMEAIRYAKQ